MLGFMFTNNLTSGLNKQRVEKCCQCQVVDNTQFFWPGTGAKI